MTLAKSDCVIQFSLGFLSVGKPALCFRERFLIFAVFRIGGCKRAHGLHRARELGCSLGEAALFR